MSYRTAFRPLTGLALLLLLWSPLLRAVIETYDFATEEQRQRYHHFVEELRCPKCQNQNLSGSNSAIAEDLRRELHRLLLEGRSDEEIVDFMVSRYGEFILYRPPLDRHTLVLWAFPGVLLLIGVVVGVLLLRRRAVPGAGDDAAAAEVHRRAAQLLDHYRKEQS